MTTPLGDIEICIDGKTIKYTAQNMGVMDRLCPDVDGRFCIKVEFVPDGERHTISCIIKSHIPSDKDGVESGERLELKSFYKGHSKLSIGMEGENGYFADGTRAFDTYDQIQTKSLSLSLCYEYHECVSAASRNAINLLQRKMSRSIIMGYWKIHVKKCKKMENENKEK